MELCYNLQTCASHSTLERDVALCAEAGFFYIEIDFAKARNFLENHELSDLTQLLSKYNIKCATINAIFGLNFCTDTQWDEIVKQFDFACDLGKAAGADTVIVLTNERVDLPVDVNDEDIFADTVQALQKLSDRGEKAGMKIALEPVGTMAVGDIDTAYRIVQCVGRQNVGLAVDDFNLFLWDLGADYEKISEIPSDKIFIVHINDAENIPFARIDQMHRCMPGDGRIDVEKYMTCVRASGYDGIVSVEVLNPAIWKKGPETVISEAFEKGKKFVY